MMIASIKHFAVSMRFPPLLFSLIPLLFLLSGCELMPVARLKPVLENPFPQLTVVAVLPFENKSDNGNVDGADFARLYAEEVQKIPGFTVLSVQLIQEKMVASGMTALSSIEDIRLLAKILGADVVVVGSVNNYSCYTPQRLGLTVEWYAANRYFYPVPAGYGLPWGTPEEEHIPNRVLSAAERELARAQLETQTPDDPESEAAYLRFLEQQKQKALQLQAEKNGTNTFSSSQDRKNSKNGLNGQNVRNGENANNGQGANSGLNTNVGQNTSNGLDEEAIDPQTQQYLKMQQNVVDNQLAYAFGGQPTIPQSFHNMRVDSRNAEQMKQKIAELLNEEEMDETGRPVVKPVLSELGRSDWTDRSQEQDRVRNEMHRTQKPPIDGMNGQFPPIPPMNNGVVYGVLIQQPSHVAVPDSKGVLAQLPGIFITFGPENRVNGAFAVDPATGMVQSPIPLAQLGLQPFQLATTVPPLTDPKIAMPGMILPNGQVALEPPNFPGLPKNWPDSRGFIPDGPQEEKPQGTIPSNVPICALTKQYNASDAEFTQALADYQFLFRDDKYVGGWQMLLTERESFITVCCRMHIWEMLSERGGARKAEQVNRTWKTWYGGRRPY
ncbi:MAG: hypothetical protein ACRC10_12015 [Thermoguttaceae bacterium]